MSKTRRVGGSGWAGLHGSFIGISKAKRGSSGGVQLAKKTKPKPKQSLKEKPKRLRINLDTLPADEGLQVAAKRVLALQSDVEKATKRLSALQNQLTVLIDKFEIAETLAKKRHDHLQRPSKAQTEKQNGKRKS